MTEMSDHYFKAEEEGRLEEWRIPPLDCRLGTWVAAEWDEDRYWYRAKITRITSLATVELQFVDFGNRMLCDKSELCKLAGHFTQERVKAFARHARLAGIKPVSGRKFSRAVSDRFQMLTSGTEINSRVWGSNELDQVVLQLKVLTGGQELNVADILIQEKLALPKIKEESSGYLQQNFPKNLARMMDDLSQKLDSFEEAHTPNRHLVAAVKGLQEEMMELRNDFRNLDDKNVQVIINKQVKLAKKILIMAMEKISEDEDHEDDDSGCGCE